MPNYIAILERVSIQKNYPKLFEFLRKGDVENNVTRLGPHVIGFYQAQDIGTLWDIFLAVLDEADEFALFEVRNGVHRKSGNDSRRLQSFLDFPDDHAG